MTRFRRPSLTPYVLSAALSLALGHSARAQATGSAAPATQTPTAARALPARLTDGEFWKLFSDFSEPDGYFRSDNLVSNEVTFQYIIPELKRVTKPGGVYLGVGPDQNFTYIVALQPKIVFIFDIRRQNALMHLMYKSLMELSPTRADFVSKLLSRPKPPGIDTTSTPQAMFAAFERVPTDSALFHRTSTAIEKHLTTTHNFALNPDDLAAIEWVHSQFFFLGPNLTYSTGGGGMRGGFGGGSRGRMPSYSELQVETDAAGVSRAYLATEANYRALKDLQVRNLIIPIVGDFGGPQAIRAVGKYLKDHNATVTAFYTSNVEQYLFQSDAWYRFFTNVGTLPLDSSSTFIRAVFNQGGRGGFGSGGSTGASGASIRSVTMLQPLADAVRAFNEGRIQQYYDVILMSR